MYLLLSDHTVDLDAFFKEARFKQTPVDLRIPKFEAEYWRPLARNMEAFGVDCFTQKGPNFSGIFPRERLGFNEFYHTSLLRVNESGSGPQKTGFSPPDTETGAVPQVTFNANRPFVYAVRCSGSDELLFVGEYNKVPASPIKYW